MLAGLLLLAVGAPASAQTTAAPAEIKSLTGQVEVERKGQTQWSPAVVGMRLAEGDNVRAHAGASAVLDLPDGSEVFLAENSRIVVAKLEVDPQSQTRQALVHLVVGKLRAAVTKASITLVRARQSNFVISTPTAVAAVRGTILEVIFDAVRNAMRVAVLVEDPQKPTGLVTCVSFFDRFSTVLVREGFASFAKGTESCSPPIPNSALPDFDRLGTLSNPIRPGASFSDPVTVPSLRDIPGLGDAAGGVSFLGGSLDGLSASPPSTLGRDTFVNQNFNNQTPLTNPATP
jgi:FecR-like protein